MRTFTLGLYGSSSLIFLLSALTGVWAAADGTTAWQRFALLAAGVCAGVVALMVANRNHAAQQENSTWLGWVGVVAAAAGAIIALVYIVAGLMPGLMTSEMTAGPLVILIPFGGSGLKWVSRRQQRSLTQATAIALGLTLLGLLLTLERTAWLGLAVGCAVALFCHAYACTTKASAMRDLLNAFVLTGLLLLLGIVLLLVILPNSRHFFVNLLGTSPYSRPYIWRDALTLIQAYRFTGSGLGQTGMVLSTYVYLFQVPFLFQVYNLFLQIGIEQGIPGIIGFGGMIVVALLQVVIAYRQGRPAMRWFCTATLASLIALTVHGSLDAGLYIGKLVPILLLPFGAAMLLPTSFKPASSYRSAAMGGAAIGALLPVVALLCLFLPSGSGAVWQANLAAVEQSRLELSAYEWPLWPIQDELRRSNAIDLSNAIAGYQRALQLDPSNSTAHRRLGQIALSLGEYENARQHLQAAYAIAPEQRVTRQLLGELYAVTGDVTHAVEVWQSGDTDPHKLELRQWWYTHLGEAQQAHWLTEALILYKHMIKLRS
ncbi:MAG: O-antigen ligase family protein [Caldilineaceae bacterium]|nr:O-antigen ligase family protein [Caldilineaceae bacterium]